MNKNYIENSLKRFLKRKVKITLGLVVSFMITGVCAFAEGTEKAEDYIAEHNKNFIMAEDYLAELGKNSIKQGEYKDSTGKYTIKIDENGNISFSGFDTNGTDKGGDVIPTVSKDMISKVTKELLENGVLSGGLKVVDFGSGAGNITENTGIIVGNQAQRLLNPKNYGILLGNIAGQALSWTGTAENYGLIVTTSTGGDRAGQHTADNFSNGKIYNYGGILATGYGQYSAGKGQSDIYNYGYIQSKWSAQIVNGGELQKVYNYGIIKSESNGQEIANKDTIKTSKIKNYGLLEVSAKDKAGQNILGGTGNTAENYGVIKTDADSIAINVAGAENHGFNYGTVIADTTGVDTTQNPVKVFEGDVTNKGLVILDNYTGNDLTNINLGNKNNGLVFSRDGNGKYSLMNKDTVAEYKEGSSITNKFIDDKTTAYVTGTGNKITENLSDKVIGTVVKDDISEKGAVITADKDLTLENTVITGYFENNGTLLDMGSHNLSLLGDTKLVASKDNFDLKEVYALNIDGTLKLLGNAEIAGKITGNGKIQEIAVNGEAGEHTSSIKLNEVLLQNATELEEKYLAGNTPEEKKANNFTEVSYKGGFETEKVTLDFDRTAEGKENTITFTDDLLIKGKDGIAIDGTGSSQDSNVNINFSSLDSEKVQGDIKLGGAHDDIVVEKNGAYTGTVDMGAGNDTFTVEKFADRITGEEEHEDIGTFNYKLSGVETITLKGDGITGNNGWHIGNDAEIVSKGENGTTLIIDNEQLHIDMNNNFGAGNVTTSLDKLAGENGANGLVIETSKDEKTGADKGLVKFTVGDEFNVSDKKFTVGADYDLSKANLGTAVIFKGTGENGKVEQNGKGEVELVVKEASELGLSDYKGIYDAVLGGLSEDDELREAVNYQGAGAFQNMIRNAGAAAEAFYTTGYAVTKDVTDTYMSVVEDFGRKAGAGEWLAYGKYVNSDTEFDGGKESKGYDGDITGTVGMIEYGVNDTTSYGIVYGQGDTEVDIQGGGKLDGDNSYFGGYVKHRTQGGIDLTGNVGITKSELDLSFASGVKVNDQVHHIITDGTSDADALTVSLKAKKDYYVADTVKLQPVVGARYSFITQDEVTSSDANFKMDEQDVTIFEGMFGGNLVKEFDVYNGKLALSVGAEYVLTDVNKDENARYSLYNEKLHFTGEEDIADNRVEGHIGIDYEHESGIGVDAKYEMIWTDKGDNSRITAGVSYRF